MPVCLTLSTMSSEKVSETAAKIRAIERIRSISGRVEWRGTSVTFWRNEKGGVVKLREGVITLTTLRGRETVLTGSLFSLSLFSDGLRTENGWSGEKTGKQREKDANDQNNYAWVAEG